MVARSSADSLACDARRVLTDPNLLRHITTFKRGWPQELVDFWDVHRERDELAKRCRRPADKPYRLLALLMRFGTPRLASLALGIQFWDDRGWWSSLREDAGSRYSEAIEHGRADMLEWALRQNPQYPSVSLMWRLAFESPAEDAALFQAIFDRFPDESRKEIRQRLEYARVNHPNVVVQLKWITETLPEIVLPSKLADRAIGAGNLALVRYLHEHPTAEGCTQEGFSQAIYQKRFDVLEFLLHHRRELFDPSPIKHSIGWSDMAVLVAIKDMGFSEVLRGHERKVLETVWYSRSTYMLDWFVDNNIFAPASVSIDDLVGWDMPEVTYIVKRLHERGMASATTQAVDTACEVGDWDLVRFFLANRTEGFTQRALDEAETAGAADIVQLLHAHEHLKFAR